VNIHMYTLQATWYQVKPVLAPENVDV